LAVRIRHERLFPFFLFFPAELKQKAYPAHSTYMRQLRTFKQGVWYEIRAFINNREPLFRRYKALALFASQFVALRA
jgi:hypothetical protein